MVRIGIMSRLPPHERGGMEHVARSALESLTELEPKWDVVAVPAFAQRGGIESVPALGDLVAAFRLGWRVVHDRFDVVFVLGSEYAWAVRPARWLSGRQMAVVVVWQGVGSREALLSRPEGSWIARGVALFRHFQSRPGLSADVLIVGHPRVQREMQIAYGYHGTARVAMNGIDAALMRDLGNTPRKTAEPGFRVVWIGQVSYRKGLDVAMQACLLARSTIRDLTLKVVGLSGLRHSEGWIQHLGFVSRRELIETLVNADVLLFPARYEGFGLVLLEAMAAGVPVVTSAATAGGIVEDGRNGYVIDGYDPADYAAALSRLWHEPNRREIMGNFNRQDVQRFSSKAMGSVYAAVARELIGPLRKRAQSVSGPI